MKLIQLTQGQFAKVDDADYEWLSKYKWYAKKSNPDAPYRAACFQRVFGQPMTIYMAREIMKCPNGMEVDHNPDRDTLNNQRENLRICTKKENLANRRKQKVAIV